MTTAKLFLTLGAVLLAVAVALGAFGAHALKARLSTELLAVYHTAVQYHFYHALGLLMVGLMAMRPSMNPTRTAPTGSWRTIGPVEGVVWAWAALGTVSAKARPRTIRAAD